MSGSHRGVLIGSALAAAAAEHPQDRITFVGDEAEEVTCRELLLEAGRLAQALARSGVNPGDPVGIRIPNSRSAWVIYAACWLAGAVVVPIPPIYGSSEVAFILSDSGARRFFTADRWRQMSYVDTLDPIRSASRLEEIVVLGDGVPDDCTAFAELERQAARLSGSAWRSPAADASAICMVCYTSGSTAKPKGARHSHDSLVAEMDQTKVRFPERQVSFTSRPLGTIAGVLALLRAIYVSSDTIVMDRWDAAAALDIVADRRVTQLPTVPFILTTLLDEAERTGASLDSLMNVSVGGSSVPASLIERAQRVGVKAYRMFGSTEQPTVTSGHWTESIGLRAESDGRALPGVGIRVVDEQGQDVAAGETGEVLTRGPDQFLGYSDPDATREVFSPDGWLRSGDLGYLSSSGHLTVTGRKKDLIIRAGINLSPSAIEDVLIRHPAVSEAAVVGVSDPLYGERPAAFVVLRPGSSLALADVREHFERSGAARQKTPEYLIVRSALPRTASGKVAKELLRQRLEESLQDVSAEEG